MLEAFSAMRAAGYTQEDVQELVTAAFQHLEGEPHQPYACGHCPPLQPHHHRVVSLPMVHPKLNPRWDVHLSGADDQLG